MGNDGGSIAKRDELVKVKVQTKSTSRRSQREKWTTCTLSNEPLREPVVADALGRLYNKEAVTQYLIDKHVGSSTKTSGAAMSHIKSLKDLTTLRLTPNPQFKPESSTSSSSSPSSSTTAPTAATSTDPLPSTSTPYICPLTSRPMNGTQRFVYIRTSASGAVMAESALKAILQGQVKEGRGGTGRKEASFTCPVTDSPYEPGSLLKSSHAAVDVDNIGHVILINPPEHSVEEKVLLLAMHRRAEEKKAASAAKRKRSEGSAGGAGKEAAAKAQDAAVDAQGDATKKVKRSRHGGGAAAAVRVK